MPAVILPEDLNQLWEALEEHPGARLYAGGTDLLVRLRAQSAPSAEPATLICLERLSAIRQIEENGGELRLGAGATHAHLLEHPLVRDDLPVLASALAQLGSPQIRNMGTLGGNLVTASPAGDTLPPLYVLGAEVELLSRQGGRRLPIESFIQGPGRVDLRLGEIVAGVTLPKPEAAAVQHFEKVGRRGALAIALVSLAAFLRLSESGLVEQARLAWGSVGPTVMRAPLAEQALLGRPLSLESLSQAAVLAEEALSPIDDLRASAAYRRSVAGNLLLRLAERAA